jgi:predicted ATPase with chaperone activity
MSKDKKYQALYGNCSWRHNIILIGHLAPENDVSKRLPSILPPMTLREALETTKIHSAQELKK